MNREKFLLVLVGLLIVMNIGLMVFLMKGKDVSKMHRPGMGPKPDELIVHELQLDEKQIEIFDSLKHWHHEEMLSLDRQFKDQVSTYFDPGNAQNDSLKRNSKQAISDIQMMRIQQTEKHFSDLNSICRKDQKEKLVELIPELVQILLGTAQRAGGPPTRQHH